MSFNQFPRLPHTPIPIAIIGAGGIVRDGHLPAYSKADFPVMGIYDVDVDRALKLQEQYPFIENVFTSLVDLIGKALKTKVVFDLAVPASNICDILEQIPRGSAVLIQKPMGENLEEARRIFNICQKRQLVSAINFQLRFAPYILAAKHIVDLELIGKIYDMEFKVCVNTPWHLWHFLNGKPRVEVLYHSIHYLDLIRFFIGNPLRVMASTIKHPNAIELEATRSSIILDYDQYTQARILTNHGHIYGPEHQESYFKLEGSKGAIKIKIGVSLDYPNGEPPKMEYIIVEDGKGWQEVPLIGGWFPDAFIGPMASLQNHYQDSQQSSTHYIEDALQTMQLVETVYRSSEVGGIKFNYFRENKL